MCESYGYQKNTPQFNQCVVSERRNAIAEREASRTREIASQAAARAKRAEFEAEQASTNARRAKRAAQDADQNSSVSSGSDWGCITAACIRAEARN